MPTKKTATKKSDIIQIKNPRTNRYVKIDRGRGVILSNKNTPGPYEGVPVKSNS